ncbi:thiamine phosphate synthase [Magnetovirga frankeli]|uniref:thiamine phosphate synthase n=1 Tax=Magnetovirga frankeli TaxID=947516 RepID=UPI0012938F62|nr:thiamine phosphate synthase [gamma proteobacterium SS-5]
MTSDPRLRGLYAITHSALCAAELIERVAAALQGGARLVQYRDKSQDRSRRLAEAQALRRLCSERQALLIINDDVELAAKVAADGVHLGREDGALELARARLGPGAIIGISCYNDLDRAAAAAAAGADYLAFGRFYPSQSKPGASPAGLEVLREARGRFDLPLVAIGGITPENGPPLIQAGADMLAVIQALFGQADVAAASREFSALFGPQMNPDGRK